MWSIFWWQQNEYDIHKFWYYYELLKDILTDFWFENIIDRTEQSDSIENTPWHLEVSANKSKNNNLNKNSKFFNLLNVTH